MSKKEDKILTILFFCHRIEIDSSDTIIDFFQNSFIKYFNYFYEKFLDKNKSKIKKFEIELALMTMCIISMIVTLSIYLECVYKRN